jgi:ABC-type multidrug transport system fused ATPase/permease subunit
MIFIDKIYAFIKIPDKNKKLFLQNEIEVSILGVAYVGTLYSIMTLATVFATYLHLGINLIILYIIFGIVGVILSLIIGHILISMKQYQQKHYLNTVTNMFTYKVPKDSKEFFYNQALIELYGAMESFFMKQYKDSNNPDDLNNAERLKKAKDIIMKINSDPR